MLDFIKKNLSWIYVSNFLLLFVSNIFLTDYPITFRIALFLVGILFFSPILLFIFVGSIREYYPIQLRSSLWIIFSSGALFYVFYLIQLDFLLGGWISNADSDELKEILMGLEKFFGIAYLVVLLALFIFISLFQASLSALRSNVKRVNYVRNVALNLGFLISILISLNYAAQLRPFSIDLTSIGKYSLSYQGEKLIKSIDKEVTITAFYPFFHRLRREVELMLNSIATANSKINFTIVDALVDEEIARAKKTDRNGNIIFESIDPDEIDIDLREKSKTVYLAKEKDLKRMEVEFISAILSITRKKKTIYFTSGHGEYSGIGDFEEQLLSIWHNNLKEFNYKVEYLDATLGFPPEIPEDADAIAIIAPQKAFVSSEKKALQDYLKNGGNILLALENERNTDFSFLLDMFQIVHKNERILSDNSVRRENSLILTTNYNSHPIVDSFIYLKDREKFTIFPTPGHFEQDKNLKKEIDEFKMTFPIRSTPNTWVDKIENNFNDQGKEYKKIFNLAVALSFDVPSADSRKQKKSRLLALADAHFLTNQFIAWPGRNYELAINSVKWLLKDEALKGLVPKRWGSGKVKLSPTQDDILFYSVVLIWPILILIMGILYLRSKDLKLLKKKKKVPSNLH